MAPKGYSGLQIALHWIIAALVIGQLLVNEDMQQAFDDRLDGKGMALAGGALWHLVGGLAVLALAIVRLGLRFSRGVPAAHPNKLVIVTWIGMATHLLLYGFIFVMPLTGALAWFAGVEFSAVLHELGRLVLVPLIGLHVAGGLAEHYYFGNDSFTRMFRPQR